MTLTDTQTRLDPAEHRWIAEGPGRAVLDALEAARPGGARFVGGCVRNALLGAPVGDIDIATQLKPDETIAALEAAGLKAVPTGLSHGTVTAIADGTGVEVTTLRRDVATDGRWAEVTYTEDWAEDSARRDFRCNAIYCDADGALFDPQDGVGDAQAGRIVFIGDAGDRIREDGLRILRFFRLHAWYGRGRPDRDGLLACARLKSMLADLSGERIWAELKKLLSAPAPEVTLRWMQTAEIPRAAIGPCHGLETAAQLAALARAEDWAPDPVLMMAALLGPGESRAAHAADRLKTSRAERERLIRLGRISFENAHAEPVDGPDTQKNLSARLFRQGADAVLDETRLRWAHARAEAARNGAETGAQDATFGRRVAAASAWTRPEFPITGKDLRDEGFAEGAALGRALHALETRWIESGFSLSRGELLADLSKDRSGGA